ncbi:MmyB family transcriptional regulator [Streptomyces sp.]
MANFAEWARHILERLHQAALRDPDDRLAALHAELERYVPQDVAPDEGHLGFAVTLLLRLRHGTGELRLMARSPPSPFATAVDVTVAELKLEAFLPADEETAAVFASAVNAERTARSCGLPPAPAR